MTVSVNPDAAQKGWLTARITGVTSTAAGGIGQILNPEGVPLLITRAFLHFRTGSTGAGNLTIGIGASGASVTDIINAQDMIEATVGGKCLYGPAAQAAKTEGTTAIWDDDEYIVITGSGSSVGLDADLFVEYIRLTE